MSQYKCIKCIISIVFALSKGKMWSFLFSCFFVHFTVFEAAWINIFVLYFPNWNKKNWKAFFKHKHINYACLVFINKAFEFIFFDAVSKMTVHVCVTYCVVNCPPPLLLCCRHNLLAAQLNPSPMFMFTCQPVRRTAGCGMGAGGPLAGLLRTCCSQKQCAPTWMLKNKDIH